MEYSIAQVEQLQRREQLAAIESEAQEAWRQVERSHLKTQFAREILRAAEAEHSVASCLCSKCPIARLAAACAFAPSEARSCHVLHPAPSSRVLRLMKCFTDRPILSNAALSSS